jgi:hypothetical protein
MFRIGIWVFREDESMSSTQFGHGDAKSELTRFGKAIAWGVRTIPSRWRFAAWEGENTNCCENVFVYEEIQTDGDSFTFPKNSTFVSIR